MKNIVRKFNWFEWSMILSVIGFTIYFSLISEGVSLLYLIIDAIAAISGIFCVVLCAKGKKSQYIWGLINVIGYIIIAFLNKYYGEVMLNAIYYLPSQFIGYYLWKKHQNDETKKVEGKKLSIKNEFPKKQENNIYTSGILEKDVEEKYYISNYEQEVLEVWDEFINGIDQKVLGFPIWSQYFGTKENFMDFPEWKRKFIIKNNQLYERNKKFIDSWLKKYNYLENFKPTDRKFEWQAGTSINSVWEGIIQFRPSGIRVKKPDNFPALVAMVQTPIIGREKRRITPREAGRLQSFPETFSYHTNDQVAYKQFGNAVNVNIIR